MSVDTVSATIAGYILARVRDDSVEVWDDDVRASIDDVQIAHADHVDEVGDPAWRCYELRDVCAGFAGSEQMRRDDVSHRIAAILRDRVPESVTFEVLGVVADALSGRPDAGDSR